MNFNIALLRGDGIGPEIVDSAVRVLEKVGERFGHTFTFTPYLIGGAALAACGIPLPDETVAAISGAIACMAPAGKQYAVRSIMKK